MKPASAAIALFVLLALCSAAIGWGRNGHASITTAAIPALPEPLRTFFQAHSGALVTASVREPPGTHYIDVDFYPEFFSNTFPRDLNELISLYGADIVNHYGTGPWTAQAYYDDLVWLLSVATNEWNWSFVFHTAGALAHYIQDLHNPMHLTLNYDGQLTGQSGLHRRYEIVLLNTQLSEGLVPFARLNDYAYMPSLLDSLFDRIYELYPYNTVILGADRAAFAIAGNRHSDSYYTHLWSEGCSSFTPHILNQAAAMTASAIYSAWRDAGFPQPPGTHSSTGASMRMYRALDSGMIVSVKGEEFQTFDVQCSFDMIDWHGISNVTHDSAQPLMFYRAVLKEENTTDDSDTSPISDL